ncbi:ribose-phosphate diphosphokinase [Aurantiacibacter marinus]|uniref:ribose-phosphate diphosphokinase n=1 Tax=Aurantiacibacter marinus TaxID=874156 RepID=A0A0H0XR06_9SPHN|nr:ribose-phosphate diphosphokinase [Aurantiacibacter marinus]KLI65043.1 ribose-phosphate pyrophosphokinase [Aurantiacibacter marinus]
MQYDPVLFALNRSRPFGERVAFGLGCRLSALEEREFESGEHKIRPLEEVGGRNVYVVHALNGERGASANDKLVRLLFFIGALKDAGAEKVTAVCPYLAYSRKDRRTKSRDPVSTRYIAALFEALGTDRLITLEAHNIAAFENAFRSCRPENLPVARLLADHIAGSLGDVEVAVVSPDTGGDKRAELFRRELARQLGRPVGKAILDKFRSEGVVSGSLFAGNVAGCTAIIVDDMIASGGTMMRAVEACRNAGARHVIAAAAHGLFDSRSALFMAGRPDRIIVTDTIQLPADLPGVARDMIELVEAAPLVAEVINRLHHGEPVSELLPFA